jgi:predicted ATPase/DNA-binding SARP family transcriptional activator
MNGNSITYRQQHSFCSKPSCRKCRDGIGHGPYWYAYQVIGGRTVRTYIGKTLPDGVQVEPAVDTSTSPIDGPPPDVLTFRLTTLGLLRLESRGEGEDWQVVTEGGWRLPQARALLVCLACAPERRLSQQQACELLWPALDAKSAAQNLRRACIALGQLPGQIFNKHAGNLLVLADQAHLQFDCETFEELLTQARALSAGQRSERIALLEQAVKLYGGDFFPEERATQWAQACRQTLRRQWISATLELVDLYLDEQRATVAIDLLDRLIAAEPSNEAAVQRLMFLLARQQRRVEAVQAYQRLANLLDTTHQAAPSPETLSLLHAIQQGREELFRPLAAASNPAEISDAGEEAEMRSKHTGEGQSETQPAPDEGSKLPAGHGEKQESIEVPIGRANQSPLVGRDPEVATLYHVLDRIEAMPGAQHFGESSTQGLLQSRPRTPRAQCVIFMGELGIGKTRLAEEGAREARRRGWTVIWSQTYAQEQGIPYGLWIAALRNVLAYTPDLARKATEIASSALYQPLHVLVPEMQEALVKAGAKEVLAYDALLPEQEELRLREAVYAFLTNLSLTSPLLLVLDDIQWADNSSAQMLGYLTRRVTDHPIVILATCRETELPANSVLSGLIAHMQREQVVEVIHVQPLSDEQIGALVSYLPEPAISHIQSRAGGNPFFAEELAYSLRTSSALGEQSALNAQEQFLPGTIAAVLDRRLNRLSKECRELVSKAAVLGGSFDLDLISALASNGPVVDNDAVLDLLDEALRSGILAEEGGGAHITFHFWHPLLASHLYNGLSATRRARLHRKIAEELQRLYPSRESEEAATIVRHLVLGGAEPARIARFAELAAHRAYSLFAYSEAENYYRLALSHLAPNLMDLPDTLPAEQELLTDAPLEDRLHLAFLSERLAECARVRGNFKDAPTFYLRAIQLRTRPPSSFATPAEERQEAQIQAILWSEIAWIWRFTGDTAAARNCNDRGEEVLRKAGISDGPAWGCLRHQQASLYWHEGYHQEALLASHQALNLFASCLAQSSSANTEQPTVPANRQTRAMRTLLGDPVDLGRAHAFLGIIYTALGQLSEALKHLHEALAIYERHNRRREAAHVCCNIGHVHLLRAEYAQARPFFQRPLSYVEQSGDILKSVLLYNMGELAAADHRLDEAEKFYREGLALVEQVNDREYLSNWSVILGGVFQEQGRFKEAAEAILRGLSIGRAFPRNQPCIGFALVALANLRCALVEKEQAASSERGKRALLHAQTDLQRALSLRGLDAEKRTQALLAQAQVSRLLGNLSLARRQALQARADAQEYELRAIQARCQRLLDLLPKA